MGQEEDQRLTTLEDVYRRIGNVQSELHEVALNKQDKIRPAVILTIIMFLFTQTVTAVWWASKLTNGVANIGEKVTALNVDRFYGKDAQQLQRLWELEHAATKAAIAEIKAQDVHTRDEVGVIRRKISAMESVQGECVKRLNLHPKAPSHN